MKQTIYLVGILLSLLSCNHLKEEKADSYFTRDNLKVLPLSNPEKVLLEDTFNDPVAYWLIQDSLVLVQNNPHSDYMIEVFSLNTRKRILGLATRGNGPGEFGNCQCIIPSSQSPVFYIKDVERFQFYTVDISKTLQNGKLAIVHRFPYSEDIHTRTDICPLNDTEYVGYHMWHLDDSTYNNGVPAVSRYTIDSTPSAVQSRAPFMDKYKYFVADVNGGNLFRVSENRIWLAELHKDKITIYDDSLQIVRTIVGPDNYPLKYEEHKSNIPMGFITFQNETSYLAYSSWTVTNDAVYLIYQHLDGKTFDPTHFQPVELYRFDKEGNPEVCYQADRHLNTLSIDSQGEYLYTVARKSSGDPVEFIRYKLK